MPHISTDLARSFAARALRGKARIPSVIREKMPPADPFTNNIILTTGDVAKAALGTFLFLPVRIPLALFVLLAGWIVARLCLIGSLAEDIDSKPISGRRKVFRDALCSPMMSLFLWICGLRITIVGKKAEYEEAPILVGAPHATYMDFMLPAIFKCSGMSKEENRSLPIFRDFLRFYQAIFVKRNDRASCALARKEVLKRVASQSDPWPQTFIFPEGGTTNRLSLLQFRHGSFAPGLPTQPVVLHYPDDDEPRDFVTCAVESNHNLVSHFFFLLTRPVTRMVIQFHPVYRPNEVEQADPDLYASNVQRWMANIMNVPALDIRHISYHRETRE